MEGIHIYHSTFTNYGFDQNPMNAAIASIEKNFHNKNIECHVPRLKSVNSQAFSDPQLYACEPIIVDSAIESRLMADKIEDMKLDSCESTEATCVLVLDKLEDLLMYTEARALITTINKLIQGKCK